MRNKTLSRPNGLLLLGILVLAGVLAACGALPDIGAATGGEEPQAVEPPPIEEPPALEPTPPPPPTATQIPVPSATPTSAFGEEATGEEATPEPETDGEPTPTRLAPLGETPEGEMTETATPEAMETIEVTPLGDGQGGGGNGDATPTPIAPPETPEPTVTTGAPVSTGPAQYTVKAGDTLGEIASAFGVTAQEIVDLNKGTYPGLESNPNLLVVGWVLTLPQTEFTGQTYIVQQADVLEEIAKDFNTTVEVLVSLNEDTYPSLRADPGEIEIGWVLRVPG